ncbi:hypothetical protein AAG570_004635 [Ranatra chinensis]|uniref:Bromo domain-containing protein n=1 Tax=Ranatra chinensis TaxID=642074 RepID=A0ABD0Y1E8_9HEMI
MASKHRNMFHKNKKQETTETLLETRPRRTSSRIEKLKTQQQMQQQRGSQKHEKMGNKSREERYLERARMASKKLELQERKSMRRSRSKSESGSSAGEGSGACYTGRQTNNSLSSATGKIIIQPTRQKFRTSQLFRRTKEDLLTGLYKVLDRLKTHEDAWPFVDPVEEEYAPKYYSVIAKPMDLKTMEDKLDDGQYGSLQQFKSDFKLIVDNCRQYNGLDNEYTQMVSRLHQAFQALVDRYLEIEASSDDEPSSEFIRGDERGLDSPMSSIGREHRRVKMLSLSYDSHSDTEMEKSRTELEDEEESKEIERKENRKPEGENYDHRDDLDLFGSKNNVLSKGRKKGAKEDKSDEKEEGEYNNGDVEEGADKSRESSQERRTREGRARAVNYREIDPSDEDDSSLGGAADDDFSDYDDTGSHDSFGVRRPPGHRPRKYHPSPRKPVKKAGVIKNAAAIEALELATEQTLKDINKWLDDTPRFSDFSSNSNSPLHVTCTEEMVSIESEYRRRLNLEKPTRLRDRLSNDLHRRKMLKEQLGLKRRREVQRTIDRLQPGKSKGNLLSKENQQQQDGLGSEAKFPAGVDCDEDAPKLSLGKVLPTDLLSFGICEVSKKESEDDCTQEKPLVVEEDPAAKVTPKAEEKVKGEEEHSKEPVLVDDVVKGEAKVEKTEPKKEKPTPNLSAWFKAFGAPKPQNNVKKKLENDDTKVVEIPKPAKEDESLLDDDKDKRLGLIQSPARRHRKTSTGSSVSERSSFSQEPLDGNSPRPSLDEPYLSPQPEVKTYYHSPVNGTIKVGFYQDTCFPKGTSEKSSSPREMPSCSPRELPSASPRTPYCSPRNMSPRPDTSPNSPPGQSPKSDYGQVFPRPGVYSTVAHYPYFEASKPPLSEQFRSVEKSVYPVKKRAYNEVSPEHSPFTGGGGSFTPTKGALDQERTFNPSPGRMPVRGAVGEPGPLPISLTPPNRHHPPIHLIDTFSEERQRFFAPDSIFNKGQPATTMYSQVSRSFGQKEEAKERASPPQPGGGRWGASSPYHRASPEPPSCKSPFLNRSASPDDSCTAPLNYSNVDTPKVELPTNFSNREAIKPPPTNSPPPVRYSKVTTPFSYASNSIEEIFPGKVNHPSSYSAGPIPTMAAGGMTFPPGDMAKLRVPPVSLAAFSSQSELLAASKLNYPLADIIASQGGSRFNYSMMQDGKPTTASGVYSQAMQDLIQSKVSGMLPGMIPPYNRPIADLISNPPQPPPAKPIKKSRKKKPVETPLNSGFQQYIPATSEAVKTTTSGSAFNFASPPPSSATKDSTYAAYIEEIRSSPYYTEAAGGASGGSSKGSTAAPYFLGQRAAAAAAYHHAFMAPQYQQFLQRHPEELLRPMMLHQGLLPPPPPSSYPAGFLGMHDAINRPSWL